MPLQSAFANIVLNSTTDGGVYSQNVPLTTTEADLFNMPSPPAQDPPAVTYSRAILATVLLTAQGNVSSQISYVVLQTDLGDGNWIDVAWLTWSGISGSALFSLSGGEAGALSYQQIRQAGQIPFTAAGANQMPLGGRFRFVGRTTLGLSSSSSSSSSSSPGFAQILASIKYKLLGLR